MEIPFSWVPSAWVIVVSIGCSVDVVGIVKLDCPLMLQVIFVYLGFPIILKDTVMVLGLDLYVVLIGDIIVNGDAKGKGRPV